MDFIYMMIGGIVGAICALLTIRQYRAAINLPRDFFATGNPKWKENVMSLLKDYDIEDEDMAGLLNQIEHDLVIYSL